MSDVNSGIAKSIYVQGSRALGISLGLACSIPLTSTAAFARPDNPTPHMQHRQDRLEQQIARHASMQAVNAGANFNLNSGRADFNAGALGNFQNLTIDVGGKQKVVTLDSKLTAGEVVAAQQVLNGGKQSIELRANGAAMGGTVSLNTNVLTSLDNSVGGSIASLTIARGVEVIDNTSGINLSGTLRNFGTISAASATSGGSDTIGADTIINGRGGAIGSYSGAGLYGASVVLNAGSSLTNNGSISSAGNLTINSPVINNVSDGGSSPTISAANSVYLNTQNLVNTGLISANTGDINISSGTALGVNGAGGTMQANNGSINFGVNNNDITVNGGNLLSQQVNFSAGDGTINATVDEATGVVNATGCVLHLNASAADLKLGVIDAYGDPIITDTGNIQITNAIVATGGAPLTLIAGGNIVSMAGNTGLDTSSAANGGSLNLIAGALTKLSGGNTVVTKGTKTGGVVDLTGGSGGTAPIASVDTSGGVAGTGGDITMVAFAGKNIGSGTVILPNGAVLNAGGGASDGNITLIGGAKTGPAISVGNFIGGNVTVATGTPATSKGGVVYNAAGGIVSGSYSTKKLNAADINFNGALGIVDGNLTVSTGGVANINGSVVGTLNTGLMTVNAGTFNVTAAGSLLSPDGLVVTATVGGNTLVDGTISVGTLNLTTDLLTISATGKLADAFENVTTKSGILVNGQLGRDPLAQDQTRLISTLNLNTGKSAIVVNVGGVISGDGVINSGTFANSGLSKGNITYTVTSTKGAPSPFSNFGTIDGLNVTINAVKGSIFNDAGAILQATLQSSPQDVPSLTLNTTAVTNLGHIEAVGEPKLTDGILTISSTKGLVISGVNGGFFTNFASTVALNAAKGDITVGGIVANVTSNPFSALGSGLGNFIVNASGAFQNTMPGVTVTSDGKGDQGTISIVAKSVDYIGVGAAPNFFLNTTGDPLSVGKTPVTLVLSGKTGIQIGAGSGQFSVNISGFDTTSTSTFTTPTNLGINMGSFILNNTGIILTGTKALLLTGNVVGGDTVTINTGNKKDFVIGGATVSGQTGIVAGEGISANKNLTINTVGKLNLANGSIIKGGDSVVMNATALTVNATSDILSSKAILNTGSSSKASYTNLNPNGLLSASELDINSTGTLTLSSGGGNATQTVLSIGIRLLGPGNLDGGGTFNIHADALKFSTKGILFNAAAPSAAQPNGGEVIITLTTTSPVKVGLGNGMIRANVAGFNGSITDPEGTGDFDLSTGGGIVATDVYNGGVNPHAINFGAGFGGGLFLGGTTVSVQGVDGIGLNLFQIESSSTAALLCSDAGNNGIKDKSVTINGGNITFENTAGGLVTNGAKLNGVELNLKSNVSIDTTKNTFFAVGSAGPVGSNIGGVINIVAPTLKVSGQNGLALIAQGGDDQGAVINVETTAAATAGNLKVGAPLTGGTLSFDVSNTGATGLGGAVSVKAGGTLVVDGFGLNFGTVAANSKASSLLLQSGQASATSSGSTLTFNNANALVLNGLAFGQATINSGSTSTFLVNGANVNTGNGFSNGAFTAGKIIINPVSGTGTLDTKNYAMITNDLTLSASTITFANQTISVVPDGAVGSSLNTGVGGKITINGTFFNFNNAGGVLLQAQGNAGNPTSVGGAITVNDAGTKTLVVGSAGFNFDVIDAGAGVTQRAGSVTVNQNGGDLTVNGNAFAFGANDGGALTLKAHDNMLVSNVGALNVFNLDQVDLETSGATTGGVFQFGSATKNGFVDVNPTLSAHTITIASDGNKAGIDASFGTVAANNLTLNTTGALNIASGGTLSVVASTLAGTLGNGGTLNITAGSLTQSGGVAGFTLAAPGTTGAGGIISLTLTGGSTLNIGAGALAVDISNASGVRGGSLTVVNNGNINCDMNFINVGANFGGAGPNLVLTANGVLAVNNATSIANIGLGGGLITTATIGGAPVAGYTNVFNIFDPLLPGGVLSINYVENPGDSTTQIAQYFAFQINNNPTLQGLGLSATTVNQVITLISNSPNTTFTETCIAPPLPAPQECPASVTLVTSTTGLTLNSRSSQAFVLGGAAPGTNGIQDNNLTLNIGAVTIGNTGSSVLATIGGSIKAGTDSLTVVDAGLPAGSVTVSVTATLGETKEQIAAALSSAINLDLNLQAIGVSSTVNGAVITLASGAAGTTYIADPVKGTKITLVTSAQGGDILNGNLVSISGAITKAVTLNASGSAGDIDNNQAIQFNGAGNLTITTNVGKDAFVESAVGATGVILNAGQRALARFTSGDVSGIAGTAGSYNFDYQNANGANANTVTVTSVTTTNGDLIVSGNMRNLVVAGSAQIFSNNGNIILQELQVGTGNINIGNDVVIHGSGAVTALNQGNVYIVTNTAIPFTTAPGVAPGGVTIDQTAGGVVTFGASGNLAGTIVADPTDVFQALGRNLAFNNNLGTITVGTNATITADPPSANTSVADILARTMTLANSTSRVDSQVTTLNSSASTAGASHSAVSNSVPTSMTPFVQVDSATANPFAASSTLSALGAINVVNLNNAVLQSELSPINNAMLNSAGNTGLLSGAGESGGTRLVNQAASYDSAKPASNTLVGGVSNSSHRSLENGPLLLAPQQDVVIDTPHGSISVAAKSLVLIIATDSGLAVYNMHDNRKNAVVVKSGEHSHSVAPGTSSMLVGHSVKAFEEFNPVQFVRYRQPACQTATAKHKLYRAEFEILSMLNGLPAFRDLMVSDNPETRKTMKSVLKTAAVLMQLSGGKDFKYFAPSQVTAYTK